MPTVPALPAIPIEFQAAALWPAALAVLAAGTVMLVLGRRSRTPPLLLLLRSALVGLLALAVLGPVYRRPARPGESGPLAVVIDRSASMRVVDAHRAPADRLRLAAA